MDAVKFLAEFKRMCKTYQGCAGCCAIENCNYMRYGIRRAKARACGYRRALEQRPPAKAVTQK